MLEEKDLQAIQAMLQPINNRLDTMQSDISTMQSDINVLKKTAAIVENDIAPKVQILLENHADLAKNTLVAKEIEERVGVLEFDMKVVKNILQSRTV